MEVIKAATYDSVGNSYAKIAVPAGYTLNVAVNSQIYSNNHIQKITLSVYHNGILSGSLDNYKVDR